jgi:hypothetical protein
MVVFTITKINEGLTEPNRPYTTWSMKELERWLRNCGLNYKELEHV